jgi:hypothetical protein
MTGRYHVALKNWVKKVVQPSELGESTATLKIQTFTFLLSLILIFPGLSLAEAPQTPPATSAAPAPGVPTAPAQTPAPTATTAAPPTTPVTPAAPATAAVTTPAATPTAAPASAAPAAPPSTAPPTVSATPAVTPAAATAPQAAVKDSRKEEDIQPTESEKTERKTGIAKLIKKFTDANGKNIPIAILEPVDYTTMEFARIAQDAILAAINRYGTFDIKPINIPINGLTLEEFRRIVATKNKDVLIVSVLKPTSFDIFLYDRRTPYFIYAHSETLSEEVQYKLTPDIVKEYCKVVVRRVLYSYMQDQYYDLPREEFPPLLHTEVPRWIASNQSWNVVNREILSRWYGSASVGAALLSGNGSSWEANLVGLQLGVKLFEPVFLEAGLDMFAYNAAVLQLRYMFDAKESPFRWSLGLGAATMFNAHTLNWDQEHTQGLGGNFLVGSGSFTFPIVEVHFKVETRVYMAMGGGGMIFTMMPGLFVMF